MPIDIQPDNQVFTDPLMSSDFANVQIICIIGGPGVGKGTQCTWLAKDLGLVHVSVGELLRAKAKKLLMEDGIDIEGRMRDGLLAPVEVVQKTLTTFLVKEMKEGKSIFLVDGFPRSLEQAHHFEAHGVEIKAALYFYAPEAAMHERMMERSKTSGRVDDTREIFQKRYKEFEEENASVLDYFQARGKLHEVDCTPTLTEVYKGNVYPLVSAMISSTLSSAEEATPSHE